MLSRAPSLDVFGSFFPIWMLCFLAAILVSGALRWVFVRAKIESELGPRAIIYPSLVTLVACGIWLIVFRY
jgi:YtcA family